ncbi:PAAR domain-containing protein [Pasteurella bettyae]|uniref:Double-stranded DNA deaminase toxin A prePAAR motif domain-containing protein n=1 Tax=Pasteurella bettyae CCUG 2042 TaxID=1095749 RepID=I3DCB1_9PAST|nr:PAAR domain-containing protein [Pasteurella bettyae]EIJ69354.1 hypothetical protein HMPREF1052_0864 [Pasteurella bettyae CCUG 2042]SUB21337.1 Uncharacterized conserved protein [Pasteurella bettyae]
MAESFDIVQRITQRINAFPRSTVQLSTPLNVVTPAARVGDIINHTSFWSALAGAVVGACVTAGIFALAGVAFAATGGLASMAIGAIATYALSGGIEKITNAVTSFVDEAIGGEPSGPIILGSPNVLVNNKPLAIADLPLSVGCTRHSPPPKIAQGSETVFANNKAVARKGDKTECSAIIAEGSQNVFIGSGQGNYVEMQPEFNGFQRALLIGVEFIVPPTALFSKGIGKAVAQAGKCVATHGAYIGAMLTNRFKRSRLAPLFRNVAKIARGSAQESYKGSTKIGHALSQHAGRKPEIWGGKIKGNMTTWNEQGIKHFDDILNAPGKFEQTISKKEIEFIEKRLPDGRGMRLNQDWTFKGFID